LSAAKSIGSRVDGLAFTQDGLQPFLDSARSNFLLGEVSSACGQKKEADELYRRSAEATGPSDLVWAWASARELGTFDSAQWRTRLNAALSQAESNLGNASARGWWFYTTGVLQIALGETEKGKASLHEALLVPESRMSYHLTRLALSGATPQAKPQ